MVWKDLWDTLLTHGLSLCNPSIFLDVDTQASPLRFLPKQLLHKVPLAPSKLTVPQYSFVSAIAFCLSAKEIEVYALEISECTDRINDMEPKGLIVVVVYDNLRWAYSEEASNELPDHGMCDMKIEFKEGQEPHNTDLRPIAPADLEELRKYPEENLGKGWIWRSKSLISPPLVFVQKKDGSIGVCMDYKTLNKVMVRNHYPLPLILELTDRLVGATIFTKLDIRQAYHHLHMTLGHEFKTTFKTHYGLFEYLVMHFGLTNAPAQFQSSFQKN